MQVKKITPVLIVDEAEPCIQFWVDRLGFEKTVEVPEGNKIGFVMLQKGNLEVMYQTVASVQKDDPHSPALSRRGPTFLYVEVESLRETLAAMKGVPFTMQVRDTFYGAKEFGVRDPGGHIVIFSQIGAAPAK
ncbi:MAG: VOC family protein [Bryobacteraceae bacterium]